MAGYSLVASYSTVQVLTPTLVNDVQYCTIQTSDSSVFASIPVSAASFNDNQAASELTNFATAIEQIMGLDGVIAGVGGQQIDPNGLLADYVVFTVALPSSGTSSGSVTAEASVPVGLLDFSDAEIGRTLEGQAEDIISATLASLQSAAGG